MIKPRHLLLTIVLPALATALSQVKPVAPPAQKSVPPSAAVATAVSTPVLVPPGPAYHAPLDQTLVYAAQWRVFPAGTITLKMEQAGKELRVVGSADASGAIGLLYHVHDRFESFLDPTSFCSRNASRNMEEGFRRVNMNITFDYQRGKAILDQKNIKKNETRHAENEIPGCVTDVISGIYYAGTLPLEAGKTYSFPLNDGGKTVTVELHVEAREQIKTPAGVFKTIRVQPDAPREVFKDKPKMWIWYSDDANRIPVQIRVRMAWGMMTFTLSRVDKK